MSNKTPLVLNYTGQIVRYKHPWKDEKSGKTTLSEIELPPIGKVVLERKHFKEDEALFFTELQVIKGLPDPKSGVLYIVPQYVAALLSGKRTDLLYITEEKEEITGNPIKPDEKKIVGEELSRFISDYQLR